MPTVAVQSCEPVEDHLETAGDPPVGFGEPDDHDPTGAPGLVAMTA